MRYLDTAQRLFRRLVKRRDGNVAMLFGLMAIPLVIATGTAVDIARAYSVKVRLNGALDAAGLAVGSTYGMTTAQQNTRLQQYFAANYPAGALGTPNTPTLLLDESGNTFTVSAVATLPTTFMKLININTLTVAATSVITRGTRGLELAIVLDNTGSMLCGDSGMSSCSTGTSHIVSLRQYSQTIVDQLYAYSTDTSRLKIGLVPYVTTVNVGHEFCGGSSPSSCNYLRKDASNHLLNARGVQINDYNGSPITFDTTQAENTAEWKGCVIEPTSSDENATPSPSTPSVAASTQTDPDFTEPAGGWTGPWNAFYWPPAGSAGGSPNPWTLASGGIVYDHTDGRISDWNNGNNNEKGPNNGCPTPIMRLATNNQAALDTALTNMQAWDAGGTIIHVGMIWGWRLLSPNPPFSDGLAYNDTSSIKVVILETDGVNELPASNHLTGLSYLADGKFNTTSSSTCNTNCSILDTRLQQVCANMKNAGISIYTIGLGAAGTSNSVLQNCAGQGVLPGGSLSGVGKFISAPTGTDLSSAFSQIAVELNKLRVKS